MSNLRSILCDLDGVLYLGPEPVPGAGDALAALDAAGLDIWLVTNNSTRTPEQAAAKVADRTGYPVRPDQVVSSALSTAAHLASSVTSALVMGGRGLVEALEEAGIAVLDPSDAPEDRPLDVDAVVIGLDYSLSYRRLRAAAMAVRNGARLVASNVDATFPTPYGLWPGAGAIVAAVERATDTAAEPCGKPHVPMQRILADRVAPGGVLMVGDRVDTDLELAWAQGWSTALVRTGVGSPEDAGDRVIDIVVDSIAELPAALGV